MRKFQQIHWTIALCGCVCIATIAGTAAAQTTKTDNAKNQSPAPGNAPPSAGTLDRARALFESGKYVEAEKLLAQALAAIDAGKLPQTELGRCLSPLADIYRAWGRYDDALKIALRYRQFIEGLKGLDPAEHDRQLVQSTCNLADIYTALSKPAEAEKYLQDDLAAMESRGDASLLPALKLAVRDAQLADDANKPDDAKARWNHAVQLGTAALEKFKEGKLPAAQLPDSVEALAAAYVATGQNDQAIAIYRRLLQTEQTRKLIEPSIKTSKFLGSLCAEAGQFDEAAQVFKDAVAAQHKLAPDTATEAELLSRLALVYTAQGKQTETQKQFDAAAAIYLKAQKQLETAGENTAGMMTVLNQLQIVQQQAGRYPEAIATCRKLLDLRRKTLGDEHPLTVAAESDLGALYGASEYYDLALPRLTSALNYWRNHKPAAPLQLARALNDLAVVEQGAGSLNEARQLLEEALKQRQQFLPPDDPRLGHTYANLASVYLAKGDYSRAVVLLDQAIDIFRKSGAANQQVLVTALLNQSMVFQSQGQLTKAIDYCRQALVAFQAAFGQNAPGAIDPCNKLSALCVAMNQLPEAAEFSRRAWDLCQRNHLEKEPIAGATLYQQAVVAFSQNRLDDAQRDFEKAMTIQQAAKAKSQIPRTLNYLARIASLHGNAEAAEPLYRTALDLQGAAFSRPTTFYITSCNLAEILYREGKADEAVKLVQRALDAIETPRADVTGGEREQAGFFEQYKKAFDLLVAWNLEQGNVDAAFAAAERGRNRTFLDQLSRAGIDLRDTLDLHDPLVGQKNQKLLDRERTLRATFATLQAQAGTLADLVTKEKAGAKGDAAAKKLAELTKQLETAQQEYAQVLSSIRSASSYRDQFADNSKLHSLAEVRGELKKLRSVMLFYYVGGTGSYLLVIDPSSDKADVVPLVVPGALADSLKVPKGPVGRQALVKLVNQFLADVRDRAGGRGLSGIITTQEGVLEAEKGTQLADVLLPREVRSKIEKLAPKCVIIVPDGALDELSFESLLLENSPAPKYLLDVFPPIAYAPSANIFMNLLKRPAPNATAVAGLTVGNPKYPQLAAATADNSNTKASAVAGSPEKETIASVSRAAYFALGGQLPLLPATADECKRISSAFSPGVFTSLESDQATEKNVRSHLAGCKFLHLAAHGLIDQQNDNLFGAIALTPPAAGITSTDDDGFLHVNEIHNLPLADCQLAVLSACQTNVGPDRPLEAGPSIAQAFLAAGCRRVVCSHWSVDDASTAELIGGFFERLAQAADKSAVAGQASSPIDYATAFHQAQLKVRSQRQWASPYYWAPFVLIGPPQ